MSHWDFGRGPADQHDAAITAADDFPYGPGEVSYRGGEQDWAEPGGGADGADLDADLDDEGFFGSYPISYERGRIEPDLADAAHDPYEPYEIWPPAPAPDDLRRPWSPPPGPQPGRQPGQQPGPGRRRLIVAGVAVAAVAVIGGAAVLLTRGQLGRAAATAPATRPASLSPALGPAVPATPAPAPATRPLTLAQARRVLAAYTAGNNRANATRSAARLAAIETGSSHAIDAAMDKTRRAAGTAPYPAFRPVSAAYYIPRSEPAGARWFVVLVANAFDASPAKVSSVEYLLFLQAAPGARWLNAIEPYLRPGASAPRIAVGRDGLATAVASSATSLAVAPVQLPGLTATSFGGPGPMAIPAGVADRTDQRSWQAKTPAPRITDRHAPATAGQAFALRTTDGGALVFYTVAATLTITPPAGSAAFQLNIPGLQSPAQPLRRAVLQYRDQFAAYDPPARAGTGAGTPAIIADYSGITRKM